MKYFNTCDKVGLISVLLAALFAGGMIAMFVVMQNNGDAHNLTLYNTTIMTVTGWAPLAKRCTICSPCAGDDGSGYPICPGCSDAPWSGMVNFKYEGCFNDTHQCKEYNGQMIGGCADTPGGAVSEAKSYYTMGLTFGGWYLNLNPQTYFTADPTMTFYFVGTIMFILLLAGISMLGVAICLCPDKKK